MLVKGLYKQNFIDLRKVQSQKAFLSCYNRNLHGQISFALQNYQLPNLKYMNRNTDLNTSFDKNSVSEVFVLAIYVSSNLHTPVNKIIENQKQRSVLGLAYVSDVLRLSFDSSNREFLLKP